MCVAPGVASGDPPGLARRAGQPPIDRHAALCDYKWLPSDDPFVESFVKPRALFRQDSFPHCDPCISQFDHTSPRVARIQICRADHYVFDSSADYCVRARRSPPGRRTGFESYVKYRPRWDRGTEIAQTFNLSVRVSCLAMVSFRHYLIVDDQNRSHSGIGARLAERLFCFFQRSAHELFVSFPRHCFER